MLKNRIKKLAVVYAIYSTSMLELLYRPDDGGSKDFRNVGKLLPDYTALQPRRQPSSYSPP
jgi:hypothetical protein